MRIEGLSYVNDSDVESKWAKYDWSSEFGSLPTRRLRGAYRRLSTQLANNVISNKDLSLFGNLVQLDFYTLVVELYYRNNSRLSWVEKELTERNKK